MFWDYNAFSTNPHQLTIKKIVKHHRAVAARLRERVACAEKAKRDRKLRALPQAEKTEVAY